MEQSRRQNAQTKSLNRILGAENTLLDSKKMKNNLMVKTDKKRR